MPADSLHSEFLKKIERELKNKDDHPITQWPVRNRKRDFLDNALQPFLEKYENDPDFWQPEERCAEVLNQVMQWSDRKNFENIRAFIIDEDESLGRLVRIPTDKGWLPAIYCYAGEDWEGPQSFDTYFAQIEDRGIVEPYENWHRKAKEEVEVTQYTQYKGLLRHLGVSWEPKTFNRIIHNLGYDQYREYCLKKARDTQHGTAQNITEVDTTFIEHFPKSITECTPSETLFIVNRIFKIFKLLPKKTAYAKYSYSGQRESGITVDSCAKFQLESTKWLPCKSALLHDGNFVKPKDSYMPKKGLGGLLPEVDRGDDIDNRRWYNDGIQEMLEALNVQEELPEDRETLHGWIKKLPTLANKENSRERLYWEPEIKKRGDIALATRAVFKHYIKTLDESQRLPWDIPAPFLCEDDKGKFLGFAPAGDLSLIDEPYLAEPSVISDILKQKDIKIFFLFMKEADPINMNRLSTRLDFEEDFSEYRSTKKQMLDEKVQRTS